MTRQMSLFDRVSPICHWEVFPNSKVTSKAQGKLYCGSCGRWIGFTGWRSYVMSEQECEEESTDEWVGTPESPSGFCKCGAYIWGKGVKFASYTEVRDEE